MKRHESKSAILSPYKCVIAITSAALLLTGCSSATPSEEKNSSTSPQPTSLDFDTSSEIGVDMTSKQPGKLAITCGERPVLTTDGYVSLKNVEIKDGSIYYYFAPHGSNYNSYIYRIEFENGQLIVRNDSSDSYEMKYRVIPGTDWKTLSTPLGSNFYGARFEIPEAIHQELGKITFASASINGEHAGTCNF